MKPSIRIVKAGGDVITHSEKRSAFIDACLLSKTPIIIVHGGGNNATDLAERLNIKSEKVNGRRITTLEMLEVAEYSFSRLNKRLASELSHAGLPAIGLSGGDLSLLVTQKRQDPSIDFGFVGDFNDHDVIPNNYLKSLLDLEITPVFCALTQDRESGGLLNTNADTIASHLASSLSTSYQTELVYVTNLPGILADVRDVSTCIRAISKDEAENLIQKQIISDGMIPKITTAYNALLKGVKRVTICHYSNFETGTHLS